MDNDTEHAAGRDRDVNLGPLGSALGFLLLAGWREAARHFARHFAEFDITPAVFGVLVLVNLNPGMTIGDLCGAMGITPNNMTRIVDRLIERDLIAKRISTHDRRARSLHLTPAGKRLLDVLNERHVAYESDFHARVGEERAAALRLFLKPFIADR